MKSGRGAHVVESVHVPAPELERQVGEADVGSLPMQVESRVPWTTLPCRPPPEAGSTEGAPAA